MQENLTVGQVEHGCQIYGPFSRTVIWVQGCSLACEGCWNQDLWTFKGGDVRRTADLIEATVLAGDEGITIMGGEPLQQSDATYDLIQRAKKANLGVFLYTGFEPSELSGKALQCTQEVDILVTGRYVQSLRDTTLRWRGSSNQSVKFLTDRYSLFEFDEGNETQIMIDENGQISVLGYPSEALLNDVLDLHLSADGPERIGPSSRPSSE